MLSQLALGRIQLLLRVFQRLRQALEFIEQARQFGLIRRRRGALEKRLQTLGTLAAAHDLPGLQQQLAAFRIAFGLQLEALAAPVPGQRHIGHQPVNRGRVCQQQRLDVQRLQTGAALGQRGVGLGQRLARLGLLLQRGQTLFSGVFGQRHMAFDLRPKLLVQRQLLQQRLDGAQLGQLGLTAPLRGQFGPDGGQMQLGGFMRAFKRFPLIGLGDGQLVAVFGFVKLAQRVVQNRRLAARIEIFFGVRLQRLQHLFDARRAGAGLEQRRAQFALALNQELPAFAQVLGIEAVHGLELLTRHAASQRQQYLGRDHAAGQRLATGRIGAAQRVVIALAPTQPDGTARHVFKAARHAHVFELVNKIVFAAHRNAVAQIGDGPQRRGLARFVRTVNQMQIGRAGKVQRRVTERTKGF